MKKYVKKLQGVELEILEEIDRICKKNNIDYFLCGGSLIGAIRHKGFIPWDDDIDIAMTRKNYNKFTKACLKDLDDKYFIDNYSVNKKCWISFTKVKKKNTLFVEDKYMDCYDDTNCIWVDIFPLDGVKDEMSKFQLWQKKVFDRLYTLITIKNGSNYYQNSKVKKYVYKFLLAIIPAGFLIFLLEKVISFHDEDKVKYLCSFSTVYSIDKDTFDKEKLLPYEEVVFEEKKFMGVKGYDYYLKKLYGDYMKLPPVSKRVNHDPYLVKFEDGEIIKFKDK